ncbi:amino acid transporter [Paenibacillus tundrae]|uniref:Amino acid transporter n=1 Tax=Paenibacillus tundrae TaxID=528187 RepID=A0ABT9WIA8_9BACL|nr:amino acid transporter [Paenibacillus tundrae]
MTIAAIVVGVLYFLTALATVGTQSYLHGGADVSLVWIISQALGSWGSLIAGLTGVFICTATVIAYTGAASRVAFALARQGAAPQWLTRLSGRFHTPIAALGFLAICFILVLGIYGSGLVSLTTLIQLPNATFILTYLGGCAAGIRLLRGNRAGVVISWVSFIATAVIFPFVGWAVLYPVVIIILYGLLSRNRKAIQ